MNNREFLKDCRKTTIKFRECRKMGLVCPRCGSEGGLVSRCTKIDCICGAEDITPISKKEFKVRNPNLPCVKSSKESGG